MKQTFLLLVGAMMFINVYSQGIQLLFKGGSVGGWNDATNWIQIGTPAGQVPIQRVPTELDEVVFSKSQSGLASVSFPNESLEPDSIVVGGTGAGTYKCRSMHISGVDLGFSRPFFYLSL